MVEKSSTKKELNLNKDYLNYKEASEYMCMSEKGFRRLNEILRSKGFIVEEVPYAEIAKMEGLLRCSTMPLIREK